HLSGSNDFTGGRVQVPTRIAGDSGTDAASTAFVSTAIAGARTASLGGAVLRSYLAGLGLANNATTPNTKLDVAAGVCADSTNAQMLSVTASTIDCGTVGANGLDAGTLANSTWYHVFAIGRNDGTTALLASTSLGSPTLPATYTLKRRIGSFKTDGTAHIVAFIQSGDEFRWAASVADVNATNPGTSAVTPALSVPTGVRVTAVGNVVVQVTSTSTTILLSDPAANNEAPIATTAGLATPGFSLVAFTGGVNVGAPFAVRTDTSAHIRYRLSASAADIKVGIFTHGWIDRRGRDD
ncbi:MAG TPA: hypothetical protein VJ777_09780, partial [Mycobacterium sp.]|nr:hypothetical protein [Mycobacterium sp.]